LQIDLSIEAQSPELARLHRFTLNAAAVNTTPSISHNSTLVMFGACPISTCSMIHLPCAVQVRSERPREPHIAMIR
jgi:hypothetical protein